MRPQMDAAAAMLRRSTLVAVASLAAAGCRQVAPAPAPVPRERVPVVAPTPVALVVRRVASLPALARSTAADVGMQPSLSTRLDSIMTTGLGEGAAPGAALMVGRFGRIVHEKGYGTLDYTTSSPAADSATLYDLASLTKVVATTTAAMMLEEEGKLTLSLPVHSYLPEFNAPDKAGITVQMLLTHSGGLEAYAPLYLKVRGRAAYIEQINARPLKSVPGTATVYSDWDMVILQAVIERITGRTLDEYVASKIFRPLGMFDTQFTPDAALRQRIAPTAIDTSRGGLLQGVVHDGNAWALGGVSGHAGLFSSARDLGVFAQMLMNGGSYNGVRIVSAATVARWTSRQASSSSRALGWDTPAPASSAGRYFSLRSFGHTGFTGTSIWIDPERSVFVVLLMNRVNSRGTATRHVQLRRDIADAVQVAIMDAPLIDWEAMR